LAEKDVGKESAPAGKPLFWFPAKRYGWGWGPPVVWQGWAVLALLACLILVGAVVILPGQGPVRFFAYSMFLCTILLAVCWLKGERPRWRRDGE
jgi:hypothetical protein